MRRIVKRILLFLVCAVPLAHLLSAQQVLQQGDKPTHKVADQLYSEPYELALQNASRVAASSSQVREVLAKDAGILVELKRWIAKEATDNGQVVDDSMLSDQAVFQRLEDDVVFRSVATRLVQRFGYLLPTVNPDSDAGKQQEFVLKERARRLVQAEAEEDQQLSRQRIESASGEDLDKENDCNGSRDSECGNERPKQTRPGRRSGSYIKSDGVQNRNSEPHDDLTPDTVPELSRTMRAKLTETDDPFLAMLSNPLSISKISAADFSSGGSPLTGRNSFPSTFYSQDAHQLQGMLRGSADDPNDQLESRASTIRHRSRSVGDFGTDFDSRTRTEASERSIEKAVEPVAMIRKTNPYSDIPSLYDMYVQASAKQVTPQRFGLEVFRNGTRDDDAVPMDMPVGPEYVVGPGDGLSINMWGGISQRITRVVDREGRISLPEAGPLLVSGRSLGDVQMAVQQALSTQYRDTSADVSLSRLRTVRVYVVGEVAEPGPYDISSLSTPLNALTAAGGITARGSLRMLKHFRGKQLIEEVDAYDLLLRGVRTDLKRLENGDSLLVPPVGPQITIDGMVRRPAIYELHGEPSLEDALELAGGVLPAAALQQVEVERLVANQKRTMISLNLSADGNAADAIQQLQSFKVQDGDRVHIYPIASFNEAALYLQGHVIRPGRYSYRDGMRLTDLVRSYSDLLPEPAGQYAEIIRLNPPDFHPSVESFDLSAALADPPNSPLLKPLDTIRVFSRFDFEPPPEVWIGGDVRQPGKYRTSGKSRLRDVVYLAGGLTPDASTDSAQLFRTKKDGSMQVLSVNLSEALVGNPKENLLLQPRDRLLIQRNLSKVEPPTVFVKGEVARPGRYPLASNMSVDDLIRVAGGLKRSADSTGADLTRHPAGDAEPANVETLTVSLNAAGDSGFDKALNDGDVLTIRQNPGWKDLGASVTLRGEVQHPGTYGIKPGETLSSVIARAGGFTELAYPYSSVLMRREVREIEMKSRDELILRVKTETQQLRALPENDQDQKNLKLNALAQTETALTQLQSNQPVGRVVVHIQPEITSWQGKPADVAVRDGDILLIPKKNNYVMVNGQVFNPTAVSFQPGRSAKWYLSQAGGVTQIADRKAVFVIRGDGSVLSAKNNSEWWSGDPLNAVLKPGDSIVVPEKAPKIGVRNWAALMQSAQAASSIALAVAYLKP